MLEDPTILADPANRDHPLNRGRKAWWMAVPGLDGGKFIYDLMGLYPATLTNMTSTGGWRGTTRPGGYGHLLFDGTDDFIQTTYTSPTTNVTFAAWVRLDAAGNFPQVMSGGSSGWELRFNSNTGKPEFVNASTGGSGTAGSSLVGTGFHRLLGTCDGTTARIYVDGVQVSSGAGAAVSAPAATAIGKRASSTLFLTGAIDDATIWSRVLSASEAFADYELSRRGYPDVINRMERTAFPPTGGARIFRGGIFHSRTIGAAA